MYARCVTIADSKCCAHFLILYISKRNEKRDEIMKLNATMPTVGGGLVNGDTLLKELFHQESRPSGRWLAMRTKDRSIPYKKIGRLVFFNVSEVRAVLERKNSVHARN